MAAWGIDREVRRALERLDRSESLDAGGPDWVTAEEVAAQGFARLWGGLIAMAFLSGTTDLHTDNQIVQAERPHVIDLETSFDALTELSESAISQHYDFVYENDLRVSLRLNRDPAAFVPLLHRLEIELRPSKNQLYRIRRSVGRPSSAHRASPTDARSWPWVCRGACEVLSPLGDPAG